MNFPEGTLEKIIIETYEDNNFEIPVTDGKIMVFINPESFNESHTISYSVEQTIGSSGAEKKFDHIKPEEFTVKLLFDSTGIFETLDPSMDAFKDQLSSFVPEAFKDVNEDTDIGISEQIANFKKRIFSVKGEIHSPNYLKIKWASLEIKCVLKKLDIAYKLFNAQGYPLRAEVSLTCVSTISKGLMNAELKKSSPDLTHTRIVKSGDTLPLMCHKIYGNTSLYLQVAKQNKLPDVRNLKVGTQIFFPPINKTN
jgi:hypothetical protein